MSAATLLSATWSWLMANLRLFRAECGTRSFQTLVVGSSYRVPRLWLSYIYPTKRTALARAPRHRSSAVPAVATRLPPDLRSTESEHNESVGEFERIVMCGQLFFVDLAEDRRLRIDGLGLPAKQARR